MDNLEQELEELRQNTKGILNKYNKISLIVGLILAIPVVILSILYGLNILYCLGIVLIIVVIINIFGTIKSNEPLQKFNKIYKNKLVLNVFKKIFDDIIYIPEQGLDEKIIEKVDVISTGDNYESNDYISAKYKNINFETSDINITEEYEDTDGDTQTRTIFYGQ